MFGLLNRDIDDIKRALSQFDDIEIGIIFGSRAIGNYKKGSDVDLVVKGELVSSRTMSALYDLLNEEYPLPYFFDLLNYHEISNEKLKEHIDSFGKKFYP
jgi:predicted nucleotidyltransferase